MTIANAAQIQKTVADPLAQYETLAPLWQKSRAVCSGERFVKSLDSLLDTTRFTNLLLPFSPTMTQRQYDFYKSEAELPGITAEFSKMLVGGLLRKQPTLSFKKDVPKDAVNWILNNFGQDDKPMSAFLDDSVWEEIQTSRAWVFVDYPRVNSEELMPEEVAKVKPYPVLWKAESVINWRTTTNTFGTSTLERVIVRGLEESYTEKNEFHAVLTDTVRVHEIVDGFYQVRVFQATAPTTNAPVISGKLQVNNIQNAPSFELKETITNILMNGERLTYIPAWPLNGGVEPCEPMLMSIIDKEIALYNKISRRNHLLYGAATYTPVISSDMTDEEFEKTVSGGLGTWIRLRQDDTASVLKTPTEALQDMDRAIAAGIEEMAKLGIRMLSPETAQSGVALEIRNAAQTARLGSLNTKISNTFKQVIALMVNWRYDLDLTSADVEFRLSDDFNPTPLGADWLRLATEWYQSGLIPRSIWINLLKQNELVEPDYDDEMGKQEITQDQTFLTANTPNQNFGEDMLKNLA